MRRPVMLKYSVAGPGGWRVTPLTRIGRFWSESHAVLAAPVGELESLVICVWICVYDGFLFSRSGTMDVKEFYELIHEPPSVFVDSLFKLIGARTF